MKYKKTILAGIVVSAFLTTLVLFQWINYLATSFVVFAGSLVAAFYIALSQARAEKAGEQDQIINAIQRLSVQEQEEALVDQLIYWAGILIKSESVLYYKTGTREVVGKAENPEEWREAFQDLAGRDQIIIWPGSPAVSSLPPGVKTLLAMPVQNDQEHHDILILVNRLAPDGYTSQDADLLRILTAQCKAVQKRFSAEKCRVNFYKDTIAFIVRGSEDERGGFKGHAERVQKIAVKLGSRLGFGEQEMKDLDMAALLHDCGKLITMPPETPGKEDKSDDVPIDWHPGRGAEFFPDEERYTFIKQGIKYHHERYNGSGYPEGLQRTEIPFIAGIIAVADIYDALTSLGEEEQRLNPQDAFNAMKKETGTLFDPLVIVALEELLPELAEEGQ